MKLPAVAIAAAFIGGSLLGWWNPLHSSSGIPFLAGNALWALALIAVALALALRGNLLAAALASLSAWISLGILGMALTQQPLPAEHILNRITAHSIDLKTPQRWHGRLRSDPQPVPWGYNFEIQLSSVDSAAAGGSLPIQGGLRLGFTPKENDPLLDIHAGDEVTFLAQARLPQVFRDEGAFDRRAYLAQQGIDLQATLRAGKLLELISPAQPTITSRLEHLRSRLRQALDRACSDSPHSAAILRAMLLGDRSFIDRTESIDYQKTGAIHVLVVAGLHLAALAWFLFWLSRRLRLPAPFAMFLVLFSLAAYLAVVEQRAPVLRAAIMAAVFIVGQFYFRRLELLNSAALAALVLLVANPRQLLDTGFQLSFLAVTCIAAIAVPFIDLRIQPYLRAARHWRDVSRDRAFTPTMAQFRLDLRDFLRAISKLAPHPLAARTQDAVAALFRGGIGVGEAFVISLVLQLGMLPLLARDFHRIATLGPIVNLFAVPLVSLIVPLGFVTLAASQLYAPLAHAVATPLLWLVALQSKIVSFFADLPHASYRIPGPPIFVVLLFFIAFALLAILLRLKSPRPWTQRVAFLSLVAVALVVATYPFHPKTIRGALEVNILDVGQGDSILVVSPSGSTLLVDGGGAFQGFPGREEHLGIDPGEDAVSSYLWSRGIKRLDAVALTHAHQDHIGGLSAVLQNFHVSRLLVGRETSAPAMRRIETLAASLQIPIEHETRGQSLEWDGVHVDVLWPDSNSGAAPSAKNNDSLVLRLRYKERSFLLPGDAEKQVEYTMLRSDERELLHADVLKVGHHGSKNSSMPEFLDMVAPQIAVISDGNENPYGHPSPVLLDRLSERGVRTLRTDEQGAVQILTDGHELKVSCFLPCPAASAELDARSSRVQPPDNHQRKQQE